MKHATTAIAAIIAAAGFAGAVQAQSMTPPGTPPGQTTQSNQYTAQTPSSPAGAPYNPYAAQQHAQHAQQHAQQQTGTAPQNTAQSHAVQHPNTMQNPGAASSTQAAGYNPFWSNHISRNSVQEVQQRLAAQGLYRGREDGVMGTETERAIAAFQHRNGLRVNGTLDQATLDRLAGPSNQGYGSAGQMPSGAASMSPPATSQAQMNQAPNAAGGYPTTGTNTGSLNYGSHAQPR